MQALGLTLSKINVWVQERLPISLKIPTYPYKPGDARWVKEWNVQLLKSHWRGPFVIGLSIVTVKVAEIIAWIHHSQIKPASLEWKFKRPSLTQPHHTRSPSGMPMSFPGRTVLPRRHQETMNDGTTALF
jgi:hypothetical protein